ncbi:hypothetical protein CBOM_06352 [Ceraceosorus bombacis]|uniref:Uncharacterized protein n=1 Tax=Ceraceosorus bombacis TaxID=401625 RepID=A0A0P1BRI7_9BASI|nr:hypothetical protein CBOM_06352 [Ceraceosorus bombacis]
MKFATALSVLAVLVAAGSAVASPGHFLYGRDVASVEIASGYSIDRLARRGGAFSKCCGGGRGGSNGGQSGTELPNIPNSRPPSYASNAPSYQSAGDPPAYGAATQHIAGGAGSQRTSTDSFLNNNQQGQWGAN